MQASLSILEQLEGFILNLKHQLETGIQLNDISEIENYWGKVSQESFAPNTAIIPLKKIAVGLWNQVLNIQNKKINSDIFLLYVRLLASECAFLACKNNLIEEEGLLLALRFLSQTGKVANDCGKNALSENCYEKCMGIVDKLNAFPLENSNLLSEKALTRFKLIFKFYCWKSESEWKNKHQEIALALLHRAKDLLIKIPEERETLAKDCYNLALQNSQDPQADRKFTIHLLEESHSIYDKLENKDSSLQSRTLRWLASEYLACENFSKALQTIQLANHEHHHPAGLYLAAKIYLMLKKEELAKEYLISTLHHPQVTFDISILACKMAFTFKSYSLAKQVISCLEEKTKSPIESAKVRMLKCEIFLSQPKLLEEELLFIDKVIQEHINGEFVLEQEDWKKLYQLCWNVGTTEYYNGEYRAALLWFEKVYKLNMENTKKDPINLSKLLLIQSKCFFLLDNLELAEKYVNDAIGFYSSKKNEMLAKSELTKLCESLDFEQTFLEVCCHEAFTHHNSSLTILALQQLLQTCSTKSTKGQSGIILRNLVKLLYEIHEEESKEKSFFDLSQTLKLGISKVNELGIEQVFNNNFEELEWLFGVSWNLGIKAIQLHQNEAAYRFFRECAFEFACYLPTNLLLIQKKILCLVFSITSVLEKKDFNSKEVEFNALKNALQDLSLSQKLFLQIKEQVETEWAQKEILFFLLEFSLKMQLEDSNIILIIQKCQALVGITIEHIEIVMNICSHEIERTDNKEFSVKVYEEVLKMGLQFVRRINSMDFARISIFIRNLIQISNSNETVYYYIEEVLKMLQGLKEGTYPEQELHWLIIYCWNRGVTFYRMSNFNGAELWMSQSLKLLKKYPNCQDYQTEMNTAYSELLNLLNQKKQK